MKKGFSLIELLAAVLIIGILSSIALPQYRKAIERARSAEPIAVWNYVEKMGRIAMTERSLSNTSDSTICNTWLEQMNLTENENGCYINDHFVYCITGCTNTYVALGTCRKTPPGNFPDDSSLYCTDWELTRNGFQITAKHRACSSYKMENACSSFFPDIN